MGGIGSGRKKKNTTGRVHTTLLMDPDHHAALVRLAENQKRGVGSAAEVLLIDGLRRAGYLQDRP